MFRPQEQRRGDSGGVLPLAKSTSGNLYIVSQSKSAAMHFQRAVVDGNALGIIVKRRSVTDRHHPAVTGVMAKRAGVLCLMSISLLWAAPGSRHAIGIS